MKKLIIISLLLCSSFAFGQANNFDLTFNSKGWRILHFGAGPNLVDEYALQSMEQPDGKFIVLADYSGTILLRYNANGSPDYTFGVDGLSAIQSLVPSVMAGQATQVVVAGYIWNGSQIAIELTRINSDGSQDITFGTDGITNFAVPGNMYPHSMVIQPDGKILVAGEIQGTPFKIFVARFSASGQPDTNFGSGGIVTSSGLENAQGGYAALQGDKIVVTGYSRGPATSYFNHILLLRYNSDGSLDSGDGGSDPGFGTSGMVTTVFPNGYPDNYYSYPKGIAIQADNKILLTGFLEHQNELNVDSTLLVIRYTANGALDAGTGGADGFATGGIFQSKFGSTNAYGTSITMVGTKPVISGIYYNQVTHQYDFITALFNEDGSLDTGFDNDGFITTGIPGIPLTEPTILPVSGSKLLLSGAGLNTTLTDYNYDMVFAKYTTSGVPDNTFNSSATVTGTLVSYVPQWYDSQVTGMVTQPDGKLVLMGTFYNSNSGINELGVARLNADGSNDASFGTNGLTTIPFTYESGIYDALGIQSDGKIIVGVSVYNELGAKYIHLYRFSTAGVPDQSFGVSGKSVITLADWQDIRSLTIQADNKILFTGEFSDGYARVVRLNSNGSLDNTFGVGGTVTSSVNSADYSNTKVVALQSDGKIVAGGQSYSVDLGNYVNFLIRYNSRTGALDNRFGSGGIVTSFWGSESVVTAMTFQPDGKIITGGTIYDTPNSHYIMQVSRYNSNGSKDTTFGTGGTVTVTLMGDVEIYMVRVQADGKILAAGNWVRYELGAELNRLVIARFTSTGTPDAGFGASGIDVISFDRWCRFRDAVVYNNRLYGAGEIQSYPWGGLVAAYALGDITPPAPPVISIDNTSVAEGETATLTVTLDKISSSPISVNYNTQDNTAISKGKNADYKSSRGSVTITAGTTTASIFIATRTDTQTNEGDENFFVKLSLSNQMSKLATIAGSGAGTVTITDGRALQALDEYTRMNEQQEQDAATAKLLVKALPNPSTGLFTLELTSGYDTPVNLRVMDNSGRLVEIKTAIAANSRIQVGSNYLPGVYYAEFTQGSEKVMVKLVKQ